MRPLPKLPARYALVVIPFLLSLMMTCVVSLIATLRSVGPTAELLRLWPGSWLLSWVIAFPLTLLMLPVVRRMTATFVESEGGSR
jgi:hypothetical protein